MAKVQLLQHLARRSYVRLAPSPIAGVGVFALREIPARTDPFQGPNAHLRLPETVVSVTQSELDELEPAVRTHVLSMFGTLDDPRPRGGPLRDRKATSSTALSPPASSRSTRRGTSTTPYRRIW